MVPNYYWQITPNRLHFLRNILLLQILFVDFHTWWRCHLIFVSHAQLSSHRSVIHKQDITELWLLSCASETEIGWQRHQVWKIITKIRNKIVKSGIWRKNRSLIWSPLNWIGPDHLLKLATSSFRRNDNDETWGLHCNLAVVHSSTGISYLHIVTLEEFIPFLDVLIMLKSISNNLE